ncbi:MAG: thioredoxin domain-containing protein [Phaeodactylibacter sp.]|nr:thioredoxin domain-containing protein [Phaeodactylibacter sp.]
MRYLLPILSLLIPLWACNGQAGRQYPFTNALIHESSPYLLQHAHNPVDWRPWKEEALEKARSEDKMLIISIGYAACHWCHVMAEESFEDTAVARIMNEHFVPIKVDREERPDVDAVYMSACQLASSRGCGWPLNVIALPDGRPVWAGTYYPKKQWVEILEYFIRTYGEKRDEMEGFAARLLKGVQQSGQPRPVEAPAPFSPEQLEAIAGNFLDNLDLKHGGRKGFPKFPVPNSYEFLLFYHQLTGSKQALAATTATLDNMARGGIYDQLGGGFARYATDGEWKVPHFEKMLYDNAQLVSLYSKAYRVVKNERYREVVYETLAFVERELTSPEGAFYASLDADSEGQEGKYYTWPLAEVDSILGGPRQSAIFDACYNLEAAGNWEAGRNILYANEDDQKILAKYNITQEELNNTLQDARRKLFEARAKRERPKLDDKALCSWNALMLQAYLDAYNTFGEAAFLAAAQRNASFLLSKMLQKDGRLNRNYKDGVSSTNAFLDDYAFCIQAFTSFYEQSFDEIWLQRAEGLAEYALAHFTDEAGSLLFYTSDIGPPLIARKMETEDNVIPSSNSAMARALFRLGLLLYRQDFLSRSEAMLQAMAPLINDTPEPNFFSNWCTLYGESAYPFYELAIVGPAYRQPAGELRRLYLPNALLLGGPTEGGLKLLKGKLQQGETYIYVCRDKACKLPVKSVAEALGQME